MSRQDRYWENRVARLERKVEERDEEIARLKARIRDMRSVLYVPEALAIIEAAEAES